jgi:VWFA-related protein
LSSLLCIAARAALQSDNTLKLRADTRVVEIEVTVRDSKGKPVEDLQQSDFTVTDNGKPRPFTIFSVNRDAFPPQLSENLPDLPPHPQLPPNVFTNIGAPPPPREGHSTILLLDGVNGWFENFAWARQAVLGMLTKIPADEKTALYVVQNGDGLPPAPQRRQTDPA